MNDIKVFEYESAAVRTVMINNEPWWVAKDVCDILGLGNSRQAVSRLESDEKGVITSDTLGGDQEMVTVNESGLYSLILTSRKPEAKKFKKWITSDVLPSIRKTGSYSVPQTEDQLIAAGYEAAMRKITLLLPKAQVYDRIADAKGHKSVQEVAAILGFGSTTFFSILRDKGILYKTNGTNLPKREHIEAGRFIVIEEPYTRNGEEHAYSRTFVTPKGEIWLAKIMSDMEESA